MHTRAGASLARGTFSMGSRSNESAQPPTAWDSRCATPSAEATRPGEEIGPGYGLATDRGEETKQRPASLGLTGPAHLEAAAGGSCLGLGPTEQLARGSGWRPSAWRPSAWRGRSRPSAGPWRAGSAHGGGSAGDDPREGWRPMGAGEMTRRATEAPFGLLAWAREQDRRGGDLGRLATEGRLADGADLAMGLAQPKVKWI